MTIASTARAFAERRPGKCHNASTNGTHYTLHKTDIAIWVSKDIVRFSWGGYCTPTTASHMNAIIAALGLVMGRVSYASARDRGEKAFDVLIHGRQKTA